MSAGDSGSFQDRTEPGAKALAARVHRWGGLASFLMIVVLIVPSAIYLTGDLRQEFGAFTYDLADVLSGPAFAASLIMIIVALRERMGDRAPRRMELALLSAYVAAAAFVAVACIRSANRHYYLDHPEQYLGMALTAWTTVVAGVQGLGWHFLGWALVMTGSAGWASRRLPRPLAVLYLLAGAASLFAYLVPDIGPGIGALALVVMIWQGILLWKGGPDDPQAAKGASSPPGPT